MRFLALALVVCLSACGPVTTDEAIQLHALVLAQAREKAQSQAISESDEISILMIAGTSKAFIDSRKPENIELAVANLGTLRDRLDKAKPPGYKPWWHFWS